MNHPFNLSYLLNCVLQLLVKYQSICHNDDGIENPMGIGRGAIQMRQQVC